MSLLGFRTQTVVWFGGGGYDPEFELRGLERLGSLGPPSNTLGLRV